MKLSRKLKSAVAATIVGTVMSPAPVDAQGVGGALGGLGNQTQNRVRGQVQSQVQQRVQAEVQQRVQARVQNQVQANVQAQVQQRVGANVAANIQRRVGNRVDASVSRAIGLAARANAAQANVRASVQNRASSTIAGAARQSDGVRTNDGLRLGSNIQLGASADANSRTNGPLDNRSNARFRTDASVNASSRASLGQVVVTQAEMSDYDQIFGQFNPLRVEGVVVPNQMAARAMTGIAATNSAGQSTGTQSDTAMLRDNPIATLSNQVDLSLLVRAAASQRLAEISATRDRAIAAGDIDLMSRADEMETRLNAFTSAQQTVIADQTSANAAASATATSSGAATVR